MWVGCSFSQNVVEHLVNREGRCRREFFTWASIERLSASTSMRGLVQASSDRTECRIIAFVGSAYKEIEPAQGIDHLGGAPKAEKQYAAVSLRELNDSGISRMVAQASACV